jgi:hypothetical protein
MVFHGFCGLGLVKPRSVRQVRLANCSNWKQKNSESQDVCTRTGWLVCSGSRTIVAKSMNPVDVVWSKLDILHVRNSTFRRYYPPRPTNKPFTLHISQNFTMSVNLWVRSLDTHSERRFELHTTIHKLKTKLELITGIPVESQKLWLYNSEHDPTPLRELSDDEKMLGFYSPVDYQFLKVEDTNPSVSFTGQLTDVSQVEKFELSEAEYAQRAGTYRDLPDPVYPMNPFTLVLYPSFGTQPNTQI